LSQTDTRTNTQTNGGINIFPRFRGDNNATAVATHNEPGSKAHIKHQ